MIKREEFENIKFRSHGIVEKEEVKELSRVPDNWRPINENNAQLRVLIRDLMWEKAEQYKIDNQGVKISDYIFIEKV